MKIKLLTIGVISLMMFGRSSEAQLLPQTQTVRALTLPSAKVTVRSGNIFLTRGSQTTQITKTGSNSEPQLSPDGHWIVFIHDTKAKAIAAGSGEGRANEVWRVATDGTHLRRLVTSHDNADVKKVLAGLSVPQFSPDGQHVYFLSAAWATSDAVHVVDVTTGHEHFVCGGNSLHVVMRGEHRGCLIVSQHKYFVESGSYDWYWLLDKNGKELGPMGDNDKLDSETD